MRFYYNRISSNLKAEITQLTFGMAVASDESGIEAFYDFAPTPAIRLISRYQAHMASACCQIAKGQTYADVFQTRLALAW